MAEEKPEEKPSKKKQPKPTKKPTGKPTDQPADQPTSQPASQPTGKPTSSTGLDTKIAGLLCYVFGWVSGLFFFISEKEDKIVHFHAIQSIMLSLSLTILFIILGSINIYLTLFTRGLTLFLYPLINLAVFGIWIYSLTLGYSGEIKKLPFIGDYAEQFAQEH